MSYVKSFKKIIGFIRNYPAINMKQDKTLLRKMEIKAVLNSGLVMA